MNPETDRDGTSSAGSRRSFLRRALLAAGAAMAWLGGSNDRQPRRAWAQGSGRALPPISLDHVALPMGREAEMIAFYRALGFEVREGAQIVSVHFGEQKLNLHRRALWERESFTLRASGARPPCGDLCWAWGGTDAELRRTLRAAGAEIEVEGERQGGAGGGDAIGWSVYVRDPDGNLLEFIRYG